LRPEQRLVVGAALRAGEIVCIFPEGKIESDVYIDNILKGPFLDFYQSVSEERGRAKFMEDGAPIHNTIRER
jgi:hypothetical protein